MIIQSEIVNHTLHISITGSGEIPYNQEHWRKVTEIAGGGPVNIHITFYNTLMVHGDIVEDILELKRDPRIKSFKIYTLQRNLSLYLNKLGLKNIFIQGKIFNKPKQQQFRAIGIGGSADSMSKIFSIIKNLPLADISVFIVQHVMEDTENLMGKLLEKKTDFGVLVPKKQELIQARMIYVASEGMHLLVKDGYVEVNKGVPVNFARPSISVLFKSLSDYYRDNLLLIVLSGYGQDGADILKSAKENGSTIIIEDPKDSEANALPTACINTGYFDYTFPIEGISSFISRNIKGYKIDEDKLSQFLADIKEKYSYDYSGYERESIKRRINLIMINEKFSTFEELSEEILANPEQFKTLFMGFSVPVTDFFRNPKVFSCLREYILPSLGSYPQLKIWCAGCASGEEVYSLSILLKELGLLPKTRIYATDINPYVLMEAKNGLYPDKTKDTFIKNYTDSGGKKFLQDYFEEKEGFIKIKDFLKENIFFFEHSLVKSGMLNEFQLIFCRNVLIYFKPELQNRVLKLFHDSLDLKGYLVLGDKEDIIINNGAQYFSAVNKVNRIYARRPG